MAFWSDRTNIIEPVRPFRFRIMDAGHDPTEFGGSPDDLGFWWWAKSATKPSFDISKQEYQLINHKIKYPGIASWKDVTIKIIDYKDDLNLDGPTKVHSFYNYLKKSKYSLNQPDGISKVDSIRNYVIEQLDADGNVLETWKLINAFITSIDFGEMNYDTETLSEITITVSYDTAELT